VSVPALGYILKGRIRMHTPEGEEEYEAGDVVYWPPGHAPEALEDSEYIDFSPSGEFGPVLDHIKAE
jgi:quercetin dioxygenase-like cupin family protein